MSEVNKFRQEAKADSPSNPGAKAQREAGEAPSETGRSYNVSHSTIL
jgi:hypothetical protein